MRGTEKESLADKLEAFARDADRLNGFTRDHIIKTLGGCVRRNIGEITAALREREGRLAMEGPSPEQEVKHLAGQCETLLRENESLREIIGKAHGACTKASLTPDERVFDATSVLSTGLTPKER